MSERRDTCRYCGKRGVHGKICSYSPYDIHVEEGDAEHCIFCGSTSYGTYCSYDPSDNHTHRHGHGNINGKPACIWCGKTGVSGTGCNFSPTFRHEF